MTVKKTMLSPPCGKITDVPYHKSSTQEKNKHPSSQTEKYHVKQIAPSHNDINRNQNFTITVFHRVIVTKLLSVGEKKARGLLLNAVIISRKTAKD